MKQFKDVERHLQRLILDSGGPLDVTNIISSVAVAGTIESLIREWTSQESNIQALDTLRKDLEIKSNMFGDLQTIFASDRSQYQKLGELGIISEGYSSELDNARNDLEHIRTRIHSLESDLSKELGTHLLVESRLIARRFC